MADVLAVVGSTILEGDEKAYRCVQETIEHKRPDKIVSGGARGIDTISIEIAEMLGIPWEEFLPDGIGWAYFKVRNLKIANACTRLARIVSKRSRTYGSGWTRDRAAEMGKFTESVTLP